MDSVLRNESPFALTTFPKVCLPSKVGEEQTNYDQSSYTWSMGEIEWHCWPRKQLDLLQDLSANECCMWLHIALLEKHFTASEWKIAPLAAAPHQHIVILSMCLWCIPGVTYYHDWWCPKSLCHADEQYGIQQ